MTADGLPLSLFIAVALLVGDPWVQDPTHAAEGPAADAHLAWPEADSAARPWAYWWWLASAVDPANLTRELQRYRKAGMGGLHIVPIYGAKGYEDRYIDYLSPKWMEMLAHAVAEARRLGMDVDMTTGTGWCFGGPNVGESEACARVVAKTFDVPQGEAFKKTVDPALTQALVAFSNAGRCVELTDRIAPNGSVDWPADDGPWTVYAVAQRSAGRMVKRAAPGGAGPMLNPFYASAIQNYLVRFDHAFAGYDGPKPRAMYHDSYEYISDWSPDLLREFEKRRGYRLQTKLDLLFGQRDDEHTARVKCDYRETISDMMVDNFTPTWVEWSHRQGCITRNQAHGSPANLLDLYAAADIPETEMFRHDRDPLVTKFASSAAHVAGRRLVGSETGTWLAEHFTETLGELKGLVDEFFVSGVNHVIYHGTCYSPDEAGWPGWHFYASTEMNPRSAIWRDAPALNAYIARCQSILQSGKPDNDLLVYWPIHDLWHDPAGLTRNMTVHKTEWLREQPLGAAARRLWARGFGFDYLSDRQLASAQAVGDRIQLPGAAYRAVVVPAASHMPLATVEKLLALARNGAAVIFQDHLPTDVPGLANLDQRKASLQPLLASVKAAPTNTPGLREAPHGKGRILIGDLDAALARAGVHRETLVDHPGLLFIRRAEPFGRHYFLANHGEEPLDGWIPLATKAASTVLMDPMTGRVGVAAVKQTPTKTPLVYLQLQPGQSVVLRSFNDHNLEGPAWPYLQPAGDPIRLSGTWQVKFIDGGPKLPAPYETQKLQSWANRDDPEAQRFAGTALYTIRFDLPDRSARRYTLDLGAVCQSARVRLNGRDMGTIFTSPFRVLVERAKPSDNLLEIEVTNVSANRIRDLDGRGVAWKTFHDINFVNIDYKPFDASNWPLHDSGLLGPVLLQPMTPVNLPHPAKP